MFSLLKKPAEEIVAIFDIGNGSIGGDPYGYPYRVTASNAFVVKKNGDTTVYGNLSVSGAGHAVLINPQGDLSMGDFHQGSTPQ